MQHFPNQKALHFKGYIFSNSDNNIGMSYTFGIAVIVNTITNSATVSIIPTTIR